MVLRIAIPLTTLGIAIAAAPAVYAQSGQNEAVSEGLDPDGEAATAGAARSQSGAVPSHLPCIPSDSPEMCSRSQPDGPSSRGSRVALESVVGLGSELGLGIAGMMVGYGLCTEHDEFFGCSGQAGFGLLLGGAIGAVGGVYLTGNGMGGDGELWATSLGGVAGTALGLVGTAGLYSATRSEAAMLLLLAAPVTGAVVGYELTSSSRSAKPRRAQSQSVRMLALPSRDGGLELGVAGQF